MNSPGNVNNLNTTEEENSILSSGVKELNTSKDLMNQLNINLKEKEGEKGIKEIAEMKKENILNIFGKMYKFFLFFFLFFLFKKMRFWNFRNNFK